MQVFFFLQTRLFQLLINIPPVLHSALSSGTIAIDPFVAAVLRDSSPPFLQPVTSLRRSPFFLVSVYIIIDAVTILVGENLISSSGNKKKRMLMYLIVWNI